MNNKISGVYKIVNTVTGDFYIGSSRNVKRRWARHKCPSAWKEHPNSKMYQDMQKYGVDCFNFEILEEVEPESLRQEEQEFIELLKPTYNRINSKGLDTERYKAARRKYEQSAKGKQALKRAANKYLNQLCEYNGKTLTLIALTMRFVKAGISNPTLEAKKYLIYEEHDEENKWKRCQE